MSPVYRIKEWRQDSYIVQKRLMLFWVIPLWEDYRGPDNLKNCEESIKLALSRNAFRPRVISVWSEKKPNGK